MKFVSIFFSIILILSCSKERMAGEYDEKQQLAQGFTPTTTPIHVLSNNLDINECFYQNNFVKLVAYDPLIKSYCWFKRNKESEDELISEDSNLIVSEEGEYIFKAKYSVPQVGKIDTTVYINLSHCLTMVELPSSFIPDYGGQFDTWFPFFIGVSDFYVRISYENSNVIFESTSENKVFNGEFKGEKLPSGSYLYYISGTYRSGYIFEKQGVFELVR